MTTPSSSGPQLPGNDGTWFLRAVGIETSPETLDDVAGASTSEAMQELWKTGEVDALTDWSPDGLSRTVERSRKFRWPVVISVVVLVAALVAAAIWLPTTSQRRADARAAEYSASLAEIRSDLPDVQQVLAVITEPGAEVSQFADLIPIVTDLRADSGSALDLAGEPLPRPWPLTSAAAFDELSPFRDQVSAQATSAQTIARRLGDVLDYRTLFREFMRVGELPTEATNFNKLNTRLATVSADSALIISELPEDATLFQHRAAAQAFVERFHVWQNDYIDALRRDATAEAAELIDEFRSLRRALGQLMVEAVATTRSEVDAEIIALAAAIEATLADLDR